MSLRFTTVFLLLGVACSSTPDASTRLRAVDAVCVEEEPADEDWTCGETRTIACEELDDAGLELTVQYEEGTCDDAELQGVAGPFEIGQNEISIEDAASGEVACVATLEVVDENPPEAETEVVELWPPNHKLVEVHLGDCIVEVRDCDDDVDARVLWVSSDEPENDNGDGNTESDIAIVGEDAVSLRAERAGGGNGRVYTIGFELTDDDENVSEGECQVWVPHDQGAGSEAIDDGAAYTVDADTDDE